MSDCLLACACRVERLCSGGGGEYKQDVLLVAGDVSDDLDVLSKTLALLAATFREVFFVPGERGLAEGLGNWKAVVGRLKRLAERGAVERLFCPPGTS